jgi:murein DD-endopeptidase MepM/ murein hydrolase activator NlpD
VQKQIVEELELRLALEAPAQQDSGVFWREETIRRGDTIGGLLARIGANARDAQQLIQSARGNSALRRLMPGRTVRAGVTADGNLMAFRYLNGTDKELAVDRTETGFIAHDTEPLLEQHIELKAGVIENSLFGATDAAGIPDAIAIQIAEIFGSDIDFHRDIRHGDRFLVIYEMSDHDGIPVESGRVLAVEFVNEGKTHRAYYFKAADGGGGYYSPDGKSLKKAFLRSPLEFSRITSGFTNARFHPILKTWRAHRGVDYAASTGTKVRATGSGRVTFVGRQSAYGNLVVIRHQGAYSTAYAHLSGFAKGIRVGAQIDQGQTVGFVGATGLATGPHLHYEFRINGEQRDPLKVVMPEAPPIATQYQAAFKARAGELSERIEMLRGIALARAN